MRNAVYDKYVIRGPESKFRGPANRANRRYNNGSSGRIILFLFPPPPLTDLCPAPIKIRLNMIYIFCWKSSYSYFGIGRYVWMKTFVLSSTRYLTSTRKLSKRCRLFFPTVKKKNFCVLIATYFYFYSNKFEYRVTRLFVEIQSY